MNTSVVSTGSGSDDTGSKEIPSLLVPISGTKLVLPTVSVAEMVPYQAPQGRESTVEDVPDWYLGTFKWRGVNVPMVSYEVLNGDPEPGVVEHSQILILNNTGVSTQLPFLCLPTQGIPRLSRVAVDEISENAQVYCKEYDQMHVYVAGELAVIPDVSKLEVACINLLGLGE